MDGSGDHSTGTATRRTLELLLGAAAVAVTLAVAAYRAGRHAGQTHYGIEDSGFQVSFGGGETLES